MIRVVLAKSYDEASSFLKNQSSKWVAIETEYGHKTLDEKCPQVDISLNHHGDLQDNIVPALAYQKFPDARYNDFIISHIDLDVLFGILWTAGWLKKTPITEELSRLIAQADVDGFHTVKPLLKKLPRDVTDRYLAIGYLVNSWIINDNGLNLKDISKEVHKLLLRIKDIILKGATSEQIAQFQQWFQEQEKAAKNQLVNIHHLCGDENLFEYRAPYSLTTAYDVGDIHANIIVQYNEQSKSISLSCYDLEVAQKFFGPEGVIAPLKKFFGKDAGGKYTIGGTSRSHDVQPEMLSGFIEFLFREYFNVPEVIDLNDKIEIVGEKTITIKDPILIKLQEKVNIADLIRSILAKG